MPFFPNSNNDVIEFLRNRGKAPLHITGGEQNDAKSETVSLSKLNRVLIYEPQEMIISVQPGIILGELQKVLALKGQWLPTLVASESLEMTLGAAVAADHFHPRALNCGALRTTILGGTFCTISGEIFKSGSRVVKSVAGYDIHRAFCGSRGRFGIILDLTMKIQPLPEMFFRFLASSENRETILNLRPTCLEEYSGKLLVEFSGYKEDISIDIDRLRSTHMIIQELHEQKWADTIKELISLRDKERGKTLSHLAKELLLKVQGVFDPEGVLV